jgi:hypothetical protein
MNTYRQIFLIMSMIDKHATEDQQSNICCACNLLVSTVLQNENF